MQINRRNFIKQSIALGAAALGTGSILSACSSSITRQDLVQKDMPNPATAMLQKEHISILHHAALAPSGHNSQPWRVRIVAPDEWIIEADPSRRLPSVDPQNREAMLSLGAFTENLVLAAGSYGFRTEANVVAQSAFDREIIKIKLHKDTPRPYPLERITQRMTVKNGYLEGEISSQNIKTLAKPFGGRLFYFPNGTPHAECIREGAIEHFRNQTYREDAQAESIKWFRLSNKDAEKYRDGLTVQGMEIQGIKGWYVSHFVSPEDFLKPSFLEQSVDHTARLAREGGGWLVITSQGNTVADLIDTGRKFERMALIAREHRIAIHPMTQFLEEKKGIDTIMGHHRADMHPQFILRVGYLNQYPQPVSLRRPVDWFVV
jgi:hypothetical protein